MKKYKVLIKCFAYNQENYIGQALEGFVKQNTSFPFVAVVVDDNSTDNTASVIKTYEKNYPDIIKGVYLEENYYSQRKDKSPLLEKWYDVCDYIAICEGDDYWIDPLKLQKQIDYLDTHPDYVLSHTNFDYLDEVHNQINSGEMTHINNTNVIKSGEDLRYAIIDNNRYRIQTMTVVYRKDAFLKIVKDLSAIKKHFLMADTQTWILFANCGKIHYLSDVTSIYRMVPGSACRQSEIGKKLRFDLSVAEMRIYMGRYINIPKDYLKRFEIDFIKCLIKYLAYDREFKSIISLDSIVYKIINSHFFRNKFILSPLRRIEDYYYR